MAEMTSGKTSRVSSSKSAHQTGKKQLFSIVMILILFLACAVTGYFLMSARDLVAEKEDIENAEPLTVPDTQMDADAKAVEVAGQDVQTLDATASVAVQTAQHAEISGKFPIGPQMALFSDRPIDLGLPSDYIEPDPPQVSVVGIMVTEKNRIAMLNILGEDDAKVVRVGTKFADGAARVTKIDKKGVTFTWMKKSYTVTM